MPRAPVAGREIRRRSRNGCWNCKARKVKCGEEKPRCSNCERLNEDCDYKIRLSWGGRPLKKKQLQNGENGSGHDPNADDQSQFIPGAGQFSINSAHFPSPQAFVSATPSNGPRKPPVPRAGGGKKSNISTYQTVFPVGDVPQPPPSAPAPTQHHQLPTTTTAAPVIPIPTTQAHHDIPPQLNVSIPAPPQTTTPPQTASQSAGPSRTNSFAWSHDESSPSTLPAVSTPPYDPLRPGYHDHRAQQFQTPYTPASSSVYTPPLTSPPVSDIRFHSPPHTTHTPEQHIFGQPLESPSTRQKSIHPPPLIFDSPSKKHKHENSTSPTQPPPISPFIHSPHGRFAVSSPGPIMATASLAGAMEGLYTSPITTAPMGMSTLHMDTSEIGMGSTVNMRDMRRLSVDDLLIAPPPVQQQPQTSYTEHHDYGHSYGASMDMVKPEPSHSPYATTGSQDTLEDDIEEIPRYDLELYGGGAGTEMTRPFWQTSSSGFGHVSIPRHLEYLPQLLLQNPKNKMYFHHYLNFTAKLLVPHDCSENPFKHILPQMAVKTDHLMNLLLAYSASHHARLRETAEPTERISSFIDETVRSLNIALNDPENATSDASLATAIMLASYQIVSPDPYTQAITWRDHLEAARRIIVSRGGAQGMHSGEQVSYFLVRWFAYLDLLGRLSGREIEAPIFSDKYWTSDSEHEEDEHTVNCFFGFTTRCVSILANIGELARKVENEKKEQLSQGMILSSNGIPFQHPSFDGSPAYHIPPDILARAEELQMELLDSREKSVGKCGHGDHTHLTDGQASIYTADFDQNELVAVNDAFHWAAEIHLYRRVLGYPTEHPGVQRAVQLIVEEMYKIRVGGTAENCLLFPMFTAGCEALDEEQRAYALQRMRTIEKTGLTQVKNARILMERVWSEGAAWWELVSGEFLG